MGNSEAIYLDTALRLQVEAHALAVHAEDIGLDGKAVAIEAGRNALEVAAAFINAEVVNLALARSLFGPLIERAYDDMDADLRKRYDNTRSFVEDEQYE